jgi:hypothetical protein
MGERPRMSCDGKHRKQGNGPGLNTGNVWGEGSLPALSDEAPPDMFHFLPPPPPPTHTSIFPLTLNSVRPERGVLCLLLKLRQMGTYGVQMIGALPWLVWRARLRVQDIFYPAFGSLVSAEQNTVFCSPPHTFSLYMSPSPSKLGRQSWRVAFLLICVSGCEMNKSYHLLYNHLRFIWRSL